MDKIRKIRPDEIGQIRGWWRMVDEIGPTESMLPLDSTYVFEWRDVPALVVTLYLNNSKSFAMVDNFIANPHLAIENRDEKVRELLSFLKATAKEMGYEGLFCLSNNSKLSKRYTELGFMKTGENLDSFYLKV